MIYRKNEADFLSQPLISHLYKLFIINSSSGVIKERGLLGLYECFSVEKCISLNKFEISFGIKILSL